MSSTNSPAPSRESAFALEGAARNFDRIVALEATDLNFTNGESVALVGPSGSGKTTLLRLLNASLAPSKGAVSVLGQPLAGQSPRSLRKLRSRIATIPQDLGLVPSLRVFQNVAAGKIGARSFFGNLRAIFFPAKADMENIFAILERLGIEDKLYAKTSQLSGGQQQRVAVARALYQQPQAILADEPVSSVDPARAASLVQLITTLAREEQLTLVMSLHNLDLAQSHFPRLIGLRSGRVQFDASPEAISPEDLAGLFDLNDDELINGE